MSVFRALKIPARRAAGMRGCKAVVAVRAALRLDDNFTNYTESVSRTSPGSAPRPATAGTLLLLQHVNFNERHTSGHALSAHHGRVAAGR